MSDFAGCHLSCRQAGEHTMIWTKCEKASEPKPSVSMARVITDECGGSFIGFDIYTLDGLADLIEPALANVKIRLGPNSLMAIEHGNTLALTTGELRAFALEAAHAIIHRND